RRDAPRRARLALPRLPPRGSRGCQGGRRGRATLTRMPTRKQRRRSQKERRHEYETVWVDSEGNELEEPPEGSVAPAEKRNGAKPKAKAKTTQQRGGRAARIPQQPSWRRAVKRGGLFGVVIFAVFAV